jgi:armadillo repeat-containing protein 2
VYGQLQQPHTISIVIRAAFILGNLTASNNKNRRLFGLRFRGVEVVVELLELVGGMFLSLREEHDSGSSNEEETALCAQLEDILIKLLRVVANVSVDRDVGALVARTEGVDMIVSLLRYAVENKEEAAEELLLNTVSAVTNLSFYVGDGDQLFPLRQEMCLYLYDVLLYDNAEAIAEAARAFGNLSRDAEVRLSACEGR